MIYRLCMGIIKSVYGILGCGVVLAEVGGIIFGITALIRKLRKRKR